MQAARQHITVEGAPPIGVISLAAQTSGPVLAVLGGVHGDEPEGVFAARALAQADIELKRGRLIIVPVAHRAAFDADTREAPGGGNLARVFPGDARGAPVERVAAALTASVLSEADMLIDLHTAGRHYDMPFMTGYIDTDDDVGKTSRRMADVFGADIVWRHRSCAPGRSLSVMAEAGKPAIYTEAAGGGALAAETVDLYVAGVLRVMAAFDMIDAEANERHAGAQHVEGDGNLDQAVLTAPREGYFAANVTAGEIVQHGQALGRIHALDQDAIAIRAPAAGVVMYVRRTARVAVGTPLVALASEVREMAA